MVADAQTFGEHTVRYYGWHSSKSCGMRAEFAKVKNIETVVDAEEEDTPFRKTCKSKWTAIIKKVYEIDPLKCPKWLPFQSTADRCWADVIEKILKKHSPGVIASRPYFPPRLQKGDAN
jgi:hypothetical protein